MLAVLLNIRICVARSVQSFGIRILWRDHTLGPEMSRYCRKRSAEGTYISGSTSCEKTQHKELEYGTGKIFSRSKIIVAYEFPPSYFRYQCSQVAELYSSVLLELLFVVVWQKTPWLPQSLRQPTNRLCSLYKDCSPCLTL